MQKFTPGPWDLDGRNVLAAWADGSESLKCVAIVSGETSQAADANARLISAAPELYAALKELAAAYDNYDGGSISEKRIQAAVDGAEAALAKATGA